MNKLEIALHGMRLMAYGFAAVMCLGVALREARRRMRDRHYDD